MTHPFEIMDFLFDQLIKIFMKMNFMIFELRINRLYKGLFLTKFFAETANREKTFLY